MRKTVIDLDEELLARVRDILGTRTRKDTVNAAMREIAAQQARGQAVDALSKMDFLSELADPQFEDRAWRAKT
jgi:Arc/MetJ family transcription regulator